MSSVEQGRGTGKTNCMNTSAILLIAYNPRVEQHDWMYSALLAADELGRRR